MGLIKLTNFIFFQIKTVNMTAIEAMNIAASNLEKANSRPEKLEAEVKRLKDVVKNPTKSNSRHFKNTS